MYIYNQHGCIAAGRYYRYLLEFSKNYNVQIELKKKKKSLLFVRVRHVRVQPNQKSCARRV